MRRTSKYSAIKSTRDGQTFASRAEARRYDLLKRRVEQGEISDLTCHPSWELEANGVRIGRYTADFSYTQNGALVVEDVKSAPTRTTDYRLRVKLLFALHGVSVIEVEGGVSKAAFTPPKRPRKKKLTNAEREFLRRSDTVTRK